MILFSCKDYGNPLSTDISDSDDSAGSNVSYTSDVKEIFDTNCTGCHGVNGSGGLNLLSYDEVITSGIVVLEYASSSSLYDRITRDESAQGDMPPSGSLTDDQIVIIETWINEGALP